MNNQQKAICRELLRLSYENGFGVLYPLAPVAKKLGIKTALYDPDRERGVLWKLGPYGSGFLHFKDDAASVAVDTKQQLELCCGFQL